MSVSAIGSSSSDTYLFGTPDDTLYSEVFAGVSIAENFPCLVSNHKTMHSPSQLNCLDIGSESTFVNALHSNSPKFGQKCGASISGDGVMNVFDMAVLTYIARKIPPYDSVQMTDLTVDSIAPNANERCSSNTPYTCEDSYVRDAKISINTQSTHQDGSWMRLTIHEPVAALQLDIQGFKHLTNANDDSWASPTKPSYRIDSKFEYFSTWDNVFNLIVFPKSLDLLTDVSISVWVETAISEICLTEKSHAMLSSDSVKLQRCFKTNHTYSEIRPLRKLFNVALPSCTTVVLSELAKPFDRFDENDMNVLERIYFNSDPSHIKCGCKNILFDLNCDGQFTFHDIRSAKNIMNGNTIQTPNIIFDANVFNLYTRARSENILTVSVQCSIFEVPDFISVLLRGNIVSYSNAFSRFSQIREIPTPNHGYRQFAIYREGDKYLTCGALFDVVFEGEIPEITNLNEKHSSFILRDHEMYPQNDDMLISNVFSKSHTVSKVPLIAHEGKVYLQRYLHIDDLPTYGCSNQFAVNYVQGAIITSSCIFGGCMNNGKSAYDSSVSYINTTRCDIHGCMDTNAVNYNSNALTDDGSCLHSKCVVPTALNFEIDDVSIKGGICIFPVVGCMDKAAANYDTHATVPGTCTFVIPGCTLQASPRFNPFATHLTEECTPIHGCTHKLAENYKSIATVDDGTCRLYGCTDPLNSKYNKFATFGDICACHDDCKDLGRFEAIGCADPKAINYGKAQRHIHGKCEYTQGLDRRTGCKDRSAWNYDKDAVYSGECTYKKPGCTIQQETLNYDSSANILDISQCIFKKYGCSDSTKVNFDLRVNTQLACIEQSIVYGCGDSRALNYNHETTHAIPCEYAMHGCMDSSSPDFNPRGSSDAPCRSAVVGCMYPLAQNYNSNANIDDVEICIL